MPNPYVHDGTLLDVFYIILSGISHVIFSNIYVRIIPLVLRKCSILNLLHFFLVQYSYFSELTELPQNEAIKFLR